MKSVTDGSYLPVYGEIVLLHGKVLYENTMIVRNGSFIFEGCICYTSNMPVPSKVRSYLCPRLIVDCGKTFVSVEELVEHTSTAHKAVAAGNSGKGKRKIVEEIVTPIIEAMPADVAKKHRAVYYGPSRTLSIGQTSKRRR